MQPETWPSGEHALKWKLKDGNSDYSKMYDNGATKNIIMLIRFIAEKNGGSINGERLLHYENSNGQSVSEKVWQKSPRG